MTGRTVGHYQILDKLGEGGTSVLYKPHETHLDRLVTVKVLPPEKVADALSRAHAAGIVPSRQPSHSATFSSSSSRARSASWL
jgi:serine/threonine protein kinase